MKANNYQKLEPYKGIWERYQRTGTATLNHVQKKELNDIYKDEFKTNVNIYCTTCVAEMFTRLFTSFEKYEQPENKELQSEGKESRAERRKRERSGKA